MNMTLQAVYKYLPKEHAESMVCEGDIRIGTLYDYRRTESYGKEIGDENEETSTKYSHDQEIKTGDQLNPFESEVITGVGPGMTVFSNYIEKKYVSENLYLYRVSLVYDHNILNLLNDDFPDEHYDTCVKIDNLKEFIGDISQALESKAKFMGCLPCSYRQRKFHYSEENESPAIIKDPKYSYQNELRFMWSSNNSNVKIEPVYLTVKNISGNCKLCL